MKTKPETALPGLAAETAQERVAAKVVVASLLLSDLREHPAVPYEEDEVTRIIQDDVTNPIHQNSQLDRLRPAGVGFWMRRPPARTFAV